MSDWLPPGLFAYGSELAAAIDGRLGRTMVGDGQAWIDLPRRLRTADVPSVPVPWGGGALCVDLGPDDVETWEGFAEVHRDEPDPEAVAVAAQEWRLPVTPYRRLHAASSGQLAAPAVNEPIGTTSIDGAKVVDLTSMWAGPLCTELLGRAGAEVHKVTSAARPDGLAGTPMHAELNAHKTVVDLDLRLAADRRSLDQLLASAELLVTSLSPRALANLDLLPEQLCVRHSRLRTMAITAFEPDAPECDWIAYGTGVHASAGLGWLDDEPRAPAYSYPDPLAGLHAAARAVDQLAGTAPPHQRVSLAGAVAPLAARAACALTRDARTDGNSHG
ncbi:CoA transferase [Candidatus Poriferisodalis sp.]|uniref:CoA transferase n=1 Tax=Candidatus Poriferisodalis sp. TaxID=3101277 RepID=UPI003B5C8098